MTRTTWLSGGDDEDNDEDNTLNPGRRRITNKIRGEPTQMTVFVENAVQELGLDIGWTTRMSSTQRLTAHAYKRLTPDMF